MVRDSKEGRTEKHERSPGLRPAMSGSMKARPREASADIRLVSSSTHGAEYVQQANVRHRHIVGQLAQRHDQIFGPKPEKAWSISIDCTESQPSSQLHPCFETVDKNIKQVFFSWPFYPRDR